MVSVHIRTICAEGFCFFTLMFAGERGLGLFLFFHAHADNAQSGILRPAITLFLNAQLLLPQAIEKSVFLLQAVVPETLSKAHAMAVTVLLEDVFHAPDGIRGRLLRAPAEIDVILDLQPPQRLFEQAEFLVYRHCHRIKSLKCRVKRDYTIPFPELYLSEVHCFSGVWT